jgi:putative FmdB family regulatory protein
MPTYEYSCSTCQSYRELILPIDKRMQPESEPCPECGEITVQLVMFSAPSLGDSVRLRVRRPDEGFKDVLREVHKRNLGSNIKDTSSFI